MSGRERFAAREDREDFSTLLPRAVELAYTRKGFISRHDVILKKPPICGDVGRIQIHPSVE